MQTDVLIIGGGLSGLAAADILHSAGVDFRLVEARDRLGGRILSPEPLSLSVSPGWRLDAGPAWIWPGQERVARLARELALTVFPQHAHGKTVFEDQNGAVRRDLSLPLNPHALRLETGMAGLIDGLAARLPADRVWTGRWPRP